jgi:hypothetical protein
MLARRSTWPIVMTHHRSALSDEELRARVAEIAWYHSIELRPRIVTPGVEETARVGFIGLPANLTGATVLDIGA